MAYDRSANFGESRINAAKARWPEPAKLWTHNRTYQKKCDIHDLTEWCDYRGGKKRGTDDYYIAADCKLCKDLKLQKYAGCADRHLGKECEVPGCKAIGGGNGGNGRKCRGADTMMNVRDGEDFRLCYSCERQRKRWEKVAGKDLSRKEFMPRMTAELKKPQAPPPFQHTRFKILKNPKYSQGDRGPCKKCNGKNKKGEWKVINNGARQLCAGCGKQERYKGQGDCYCCGRDADGTCGMAFNHEDPHLVCDPCYAKKRKHHLPSYRFLKENIFSVKNCQRPLCNKPIFWGLAGKTKHDTGCIDHLHFKYLSKDDKKEWPKGKLRGALCNNCNLEEGKFAKFYNDSARWGAYVDYNENPPFDCLLHLMH